MLPGSDLTARVIGLAIGVHRELGPGLLESVYEECLCHELTAASIPHQRQLAIPVIYRDTHLDAGFRADILIPPSLILEIKSVEVLAPIHEAQILTYLRMSGCELGLLMNFNTLRLKDGLRRYGLSKRTGAPSATRPRSSE
jgi:GxxExxY protein